jgi:hypothetical protein
VVVDYRFLRSDEPTRTTPTTPEFVGIDHRRVTAFAPGEHSAYVHAWWDQVPDIGYRIEAVHRLTDLGAVVTQAKRGTSQEGFEAEWREINLLTVEGDLFNRSEFFDETDLDDALARFDELHRPSSRLENAASRVVKRFLAQFASRDWDAIAEALADDFSNDDRRRVVGAGVRHGRDAQIASMRAISNLTNVTRPSWPPEGSASSSHEPGSRTLIKSRGRFL